MQRELPRQRGGPVVLTFDNKLENEGEVLETLLSSLARGQLPPETWTKFHLAAVRDDRLAEVAFAYESTAQGKRLKTLQPAVVAEFFFRASTFFSDAFGDELGAVSYLERALGASPTHAASFEKIEQLLTKTSSWRKIADLCVSTAPHRPRGEQSALLRRAGELYGKEGASDDKIVEIYQQILRLEPQDDQTRDLLEARYLRANRHRDVARLLEQALVTDPLPSDEYAWRARSRLIELYAGHLHEPERSMPHIEALLGHDASHEEARRVATKLLEVKGLAARAAAALAAAFDQTGLPSDVARLLAIELEHTRGPKRREVLRKIGILRQERLGDGAGAFESFEAALALDPADDDVRARYVVLAKQLNKELEGARALNRAGATAKDPALRAKLAAEVGDLYLAGGDAKRAKATFIGVLAMPEVEAHASLVAARALCAIFAAEKDYAALADALERVALAEPDPERRQIANEELAELATGTLNDSVRAIGAWKRLLGTSARGRALAALEPLYEASGDAGELASVLEERAKDAGNPAEARRIGFRAAEVLTATSTDAARASMAWQSLVTTYGPARDAYARWIPILEAQRQWSDLASALDADAMLAPDSEQATILARLGSVRLLKTREPSLAIDAFRRALDSDPAEKAGRSALEKMLVGGDHRLEAARVLEPIYRREGADAGLLKILDLKAHLETDPDTRLEALEEALRITDKGDPQAERARGLDVVGRGLAEAVASDRPVATWIERLDRFAPLGSDPKKRAAVLSHALGSRTIESASLLDVAKRTGEALAANGEVAAALEVYRRALVFDPTSGELLTSVDDLLRDQGEPLERIELYRAALDRGPDALRRRALLHKIGAIQKTDVGDFPAAIETYRTMLANDPQDREAHAALVELYAATSQLDALSDLLERYLVHATGEDARSTRLALAEVATSRGDRERATAHLRTVLGESPLAADELAAIERIAGSIGQIDIQRETLQRRASLSEDPREQVTWLDKLATLEFSGGDLDSATALWKQAAQTAEKTGDDEQARRFYEQVRSIAPHDGEAALRLATLLERAEEWKALPELYAVLLETTELVRARVSILMRHARVLAEHLDDPAGALVSAAQAFQLAAEGTDRREVLTVFTHLALLGKGTHIFAQAMDDAIASLVGESVEIVAERADLAMAKARVMAANREGRDAAATAYRAVLDDSRVDETRVKAALLAFESLLASDTGEGRRADRRWLLSWKADHAPEGGLVPALLAWASAEEATFGDLPRALELHRRAMSIDPENSDVMAAVSRLSLATGDVQSAIRVLTLRRDRSEGASRAALDLELATIFVERTDRPEDALPSVAAVLQGSPQDDAGLALAARLLATPGAHAAAVAILERACDGVEDPEVRAQVLRHLLDAQGDPPDPRELRRRWYERLLDLHHAQGNVDLALHTALAAASELPTVDSLWDRAEALARELQRPSEVADLYHFALTLDLPHDSALALGERAVSFHEEWFEDPAGVVRILERVLEIDPAAAWAFDRLKLLFDAGERWDDLFALFDRALASAEGERRLSLLEDAAQIAKDFANDSDRAIEYLEQLLAVRPGDARLVAALERLYERHGSHRELIVLLSAQLASLDPTHAQRARARIALLWLDEIGDSASALAVIEEILVHPERAGVEVFALLEKVLAGAPPHAEARESIVPPSGGSAEPRKRDSVPAKSKRVPVRQRAAVLLKEFYTDAGRDADLVRILEIELETTKSAKERIRRHKQVAALYVKLGNDAAATEHYASLVMLEPKVALHRTHLAELAAKIGRYDRLAEVLAAAAEDCDEDDLRVELLVHAADVQATNLRDTARAIDLLLRVLALPDVTTEAALTAALRAEPLLEAAGRSWERLDVLERIATLSPEPDERNTARTTAALVATELGENSRAIAAWEARLTEGDTADALDGLVYLLERERRWSRLIEILERRAETDRTPAEKRTDRVRIARVQGAELAAVPKAIEAWRAVEHEFGESDESMDALASLLQQAERWQELDDLLERGAARALTSERRAELLHRLGDLQRQELGAHERAIGSYDAALTADPHNEGAREGLRSLLEDATCRGAAVAVLLKAFAATDEWSLTLGVTEHRLASAADAQARVGVLREVAHLAEQRGKDQGLALQAIQRAFLDLPQDTDVGAEFSRLAHATGEWRSYADAYRQVIARTESLANDDRDLAWTARLRLTLGEVCEMRLDDVRGALDCYVKAAEEAPADASVARAVVRAGGATAQWEAVARTVVAFARAVGRADEEIFGAVEAAAQGPGGWDGATVAFARAVELTDALDAPLARDVEARIGAWHRDRRGDPEAAEAAFARALTHDESNAELLAALAHIQRRAKGRPLIDSLLRLSQATGGDLALLREAAEIATESVADRSLAKSILESLMKLATQRWVGDLAVTSPSVGSPEGPVPLVRWALDQLVRIHEDENNPARTVDLLVETARLPFDVEVSRAMLHDAARRAQTTLNDVDRAIVLYATLYDENPEDSGATNALVALLETESRHGELLALRRRQISNAKTTAERLVLRLASAKLYARLGDVDGAIESLQSNLAEDGRHAETCAHLFALFESNARFAELGAALAGQAELAEAHGEAVAAADLWSRAAVVYEEKVDNGDLAVTYYKRVVALEARASSLDALARLSAQRDDHASASQYLERLRIQAGDGENGALTLRLADALTASGRADLARTRLEEALASMPEIEPIRGRLANVYRRAQAWEPLAELLSTGAAHAPDKGTRRQRLLDGAELYITQCGKPELAVPLFERASDLEPDNRAIRLALADALGAAGRFAEARTLLRALVESFGGRRPKERAPVHYHLARLELKMGDRARALVELDAATRIDPANPQILRALAELARDDGQLDRAERSFRALLVALKRPEDAEESAPMVRSEVLLELSTIAERQGEHDRANEILESALETATKSDIEGQRLERALRDRGEYQTLVRVLEARLAQAGSSSRAAALLSDLAEVLDVQLGHLADAFVARLRAVTLLPDSDKAHVAALALARRTDGLVRYVEETEKLVAQAENAGQLVQACALLLRQGKVTEEELADDTRAARIYERARALEMGSEHELEVLRALDRVYERLHDGDAQARILAQRIDAESKLADPEVASDALYRFAALRLESVNTLDEGCDRIEMAVARRGDAVRAVSILKTAAYAHPASRRVLTLYEQVARAPGHERSLVDALTRLATLPSVSLEPLREAVGIAKALGDGVLTETLLRQYLDRAQDSREVVVTGWALAALAELREGAGDLSEAIDLKQRAADVSDLDDARRLHFEVAHLAAGALDDLPLAAKTYEGILGREPADREAWEPLLDVYRRTQNLGKLVALLGKVVDFVDDGGERSRLRLERVRVLMAQDGADRDAALLLREIVDDDPTQVDAAILLAQILEHSGREDELGELLAKQIDLAKDRSDSASVCSLSLRLAALLEKRNQVDARATLYAALEWEPKSRDILAALVRLFDGNGDPSDRADVLERLLVLESGEPAEKIALELSALRSGIGDAEGADRALELGYRACPGSAIGARLEKTYRQRGAWARLADLFAVDASAQGDPGRQVARLREAAEIYGKQLSDPKKSASLLARARVVLPDDRSLLNELVEILAESRDYAAAVSELSAAIDRQAPLLGDGELTIPSSVSASAAPLFARRAQLRIDLGETEAALRDLEEAFRLGGAPFVGQHAAQLERLRRIAAEQRDAVTERALRLRLAEVLPLAGDVDAARALLSELVKSNPKDRDALRLLARIEEAAQHWEAVTATYRRLVALEEGDAVVDIALRLADACERTGRFADSRGALERARLTAPNNEALRARLQGLYEQTGAFKELAEMSLADAKEAKDVAGRFAHLLRAGALFVQHGADPTVAITALEEARALRPSDPECTVLLADAYTLGGRPADAVELINQAIAVHKGRRSRDLGALYHRLARVAHHSGETATELAWLASALDMDAQNGLVASELAAVAMQLGQAEVAQRALRAITMLKGSATSSMSKAVAYQHLGEIARQQGDTKRAVMLLKRAIDDDPALMSARALLDALQAE